MKYFAFRVDTPFVGECADVYIEAETSDDAVVVAAECADENGMEWLGEMSEEELQEEYDMDYEDYYANCTYMMLGELTKEQFNEMILDGEWCVYHGEENV